MYSRAVGAAKIAELKQTAQTKWDKVKRLERPLSNSEQDRVQEAKKLLEKGRLAAAITILDEITAGSSS